MEAASSSPSPRDWWRDCCWMMNWRKVGILCHLQRRCSPEGSQCWREFSAAWQVSCLGLFQPCQSCRPCPSAYRDSLRSRRATSWWSGWRRAGFVTETCWDCHQYHWSWRIWRKVWVLISHWSRWLPRHNSPQARMFPPQSQANTNHWRCCVSCHNPLSVFL